MKRVPEQHPGIQRRKRSPICPHARAAALAWLVCLQGQPCHAALPIAKSAGTLSSATGSPADGPRWIGTHFRDLAFIRGKAVVFDDLRCQAFEIDLATSTRLSDPFVTTRQTGPGVNCPDGLVGDVLLVREAKRDRVLEPLSHVQLIELSPPDDIQNLWANTGTLVVAVEFFRTRTRKSPPAVRAFDRATGRLNWTTSIPEEYDVGDTLTFDNTNLYVKVSSWRNHSTLLRAIRLKDGSTAWQSGPSSLHPSVGAAGVVVAFSNVISLLEPLTGAVRWKLTLPTYAEDAIVNGDKVHILLGDRKTPTLITLAASDGHELWRRTLPLAPYTTPRNPSALVAVAGRVFGLGTLNDSGSLLSGFDATTGQPTLAYWLASNHDIGLHDGNPALLWGQHVSDFKTVLFDPMLTLPPRTWEVKGTLKHDKRSLFVGQLLEGIQVCSPEGCVRTNRHGQFQIGGKSRGELPLWVTPKDWVDSHRSVAPPPRRFYTSCDVEPMHLNLEEETSKILEPSTSRPAPPHRAILSPCRIVR